MLATPGIEGVFVGPSDLSIALSGGGAVDPHGPDVDAALSHVVDRARTCGKFAGLFCLDGMGAKAALARGFALCTRLVGSFAAARRGPHRTRGRLLKAGQPATAVRDPLGYGISYPAADSRRRGAPSPQPSALDVARQNARTPGSEAGCGAWRPQ
nr:aldolase/citrate lyase family protein [Bradyrhizobium sp.]